MQWSAFGISIILLIAIAGCATTQSTATADASKRESASTAVARKLPMPPTATRAPATKSEVVAKNAPEDLNAKPHTKADWTPPGGIHKNQWKVIVVHHSGSPKSSPNSMDQYHHQRGWENGLGYHFVIGNGVGYADGAVFVGQRWRKQIAGAHCRTGDGKFFGVWRPDGFFNDQGIGICLVGDFESSRPTQKQLASLRELCKFLSAKCGINPKNIYGHGEVTHRTECPGDRIDMASIRRSMSQVTAGSD